MTMYLVVADDCNGENKDLIVNADSPLEAGQMMLDFYDHDLDDFGGLDTNIRVFVINMPLVKGPVEWPNPECLTQSITGKLVVI